MQSAYAVLTILKNKKPAFVVIKMPLGLISVLAPMLTQNLEVLAQYFPMVNVKVTDAITIQPNTPQHSDLEKIVGGLPENSDHYGYYKLEPPHCSP